MNDSEARRDRAQAQEERAIASITAIFAGGNLTEETTTLSNDFTDRQTARVAAWFARRQTSDSGEADH